METTARMVAFQDAREEKPQKRKQKRSQGHRERETERERCGKERVGVVMRWFGGWWRNQRESVRYPLLIDHEPGVVAQKE